MLDRLLMGAAVEQRGVERFGLVGEHIDDEKLKTFYSRLSVSEANHTDTFYKLALKYFPQEQVAARWDQWLDWEAEAMLAVPPRPALH